MRMIYKYFISFQHTLQLPLDARVVHFDIQQEPTIWVELNIESPTYSREFRIFGTGHVLPTNAQYLKTTIQGPFVWHLYELT